MWRWRYIPLIGKRSKAKNGVIPLLAWQRQQEFPICPTPEDPAACNVYNELEFPEEVYENINEFWEERAGAEERALRT